MWSRKEDVWFLIEKFSCFAFYRQFNLWDFTKEIWLLIYFIFSAQFFSITAQISIKLTSSPQACDGVLCNCNPNNQKLFPPKHLPDLIYFGQTGCIFRTNRISRYLPTSCIFGLQGKSAYFCIFCHMLCWGLGHPFLLFTKIFPQKSVGVVSSVNCIASSFQLPRGVLIGLLLDIIFGPARRKALERCSLRCCLFFIIIVRNCNGKVNFRFLVAKELKNLRKTFSKFKSITLTPTPREC